MRPTKACITVYLLGLLSPVLAQPSEANGGIHKDLFLSGSVAIGSREMGDCRFSTSIAPVLFRTLSFERKYRLIQVRVNNRSATSLSFSKRNDIVRVMLRNASGERTVRAVLDLAGAQPTIWNRLSLEMRETLAYPQRVSAREEGTMFLFLPWAESNGVPTRIELQLIGIPNKKIVVAEPPATAD